MIKLVLLTGLACAKPPSTDASVGSAPAENQVLFEGVRVDRFEQDRLRYRARIRNARLDRDSGRVIGETVSADCLDADAQVSASVTAPRMVSDLRSRVVRLEDGVVITDRARRTLRTETLQYDSGADQLETSPEVEIEGDNFRARGGRLTGQPRGGQLEIAGPSTATVTPSSRDAR